MRRLRTIALLLPLLVAGCATNALWNKNRGQLDADNEPAANSHLQLFAASRQKDFLVVYDEYSERHNSTRTRAYFLNQNEPRIEQRYRPHYVSTKLSRGLPPIRVWETWPLATTNFPPSVYAVITTNKQAFTIYASERGTNHDLPVYNDGWGQVDRIALTPVTVVMDLTIIGSYLGCLWIYSGGPGLKSN